MRAVGIRKRLALLLAVGIAAGALAETGCSKRQEAECCPCSQGKPLDQELLLLLASARAFHHQADLYLQQGETDRAIEAIRGILALKLDPKWAEAEEARLDAVARLAKLLLSKNAETEALILADKEIGNVHRESFYLSNLHGVRGEILQARAGRLDAEGKKEEARRAARDAIAAFEQSIGINKRLQQQQLRSGGAR